MFQISLGIFQKERGPSERNESNELYCFSVKDIYDYFRGVMAVGELSERALLLTEDAIEQNPNSEFSRDYTKRTSISFINVKKNRNPKSDKKPKFYDVENVAVSYSFSEEFHKDYNIERFVNQNLMAGINYNFNFTPFVIEPFKKSEKLRGRYWRFIKDLNFNPVPKNLSINSKINRNYNLQQSRNLIEGLTAQPELIQRRFLFDWDYTIGFDLTKSLQL